MAEIIVPCLSHFVCVRLEESRISVSRFVISDGVIHKEFEYHTGDFFFFEGLFVYLFCIAFWSSTHELCFRIFGGQNCVIAWTLLDHL